MNKKLKAYLEKKIEISQRLLEGKMFYVHDSQIDCVPVPVMTVTAAKKKGLVLKRGAKMVGEWRFTLSRANGTGYGNLFLSSSFKKKES